MDCFRKLEKVVNRWIALSKLQTNVSLLLFYYQVNDDLNERLKKKGINVVANVGFKSDPAEALYILKVM